MITAFDSKAAVPGALCIGCAAPLHPLSFGQFLVAYVCENEDCVRCGFLVRSFRLEVEIDAETL